MADLYTTRTNRLFVNFALLLLILTACLGFLLRSYALVDIPIINYKHLLHAHSHVAFLGWAFFGLITLIIQNFFDDVSVKRSRLRYFLYSMFLIVPAMVISFLCEGYGFWSILISTIHMILSIWFAFVFFKSTKETHSISVRLVRWAFIFMIISLIGPLVLGPLSVLGYKHTMWYNLSIYFYLHFQYNGWLTMAIVGLVLKVFKEVKPQGYLTDWNALRLTVAGVFLAYFHSALGYDLSWVISALSALGYILQIAGISLFIFPRIDRVKSFFYLGRPWVGKLLLWMMLLAFFLKYFLPLISITDPFRNLAFNNRNLVIAYIHLILLGFVSGFLLWKLILKNIKNIWSEAGVVLFIIAISLSEILLVMIGLGWLGTFVLYFNEMMLLLSFLLLIASILIYGGFISNKNQVGANSIDE